MDGSLTQVSAIRYRMMEMMAITLDILWKGINPRPSKRRPNEVFLFKGPLSLEKSKVMKMEV